MRYRRLGPAGAVVSEVGLGTNNIGRRVDERGAAALLDKAQEVGVNFIDTAESYGGGLSEEFLGAALRGRRDEFVVATKTGAGDEAGKLSRGRIQRRLEASLERLQTDHVDVYYLHFPDPGTPLDESLRALDDLVRAGKVIYPAISNHPAWQVAEAVGAARHQGWAAPVVTQNSYSLLDRAAEAELLPACRHLGLSLVPYSPLAGGFLTGKYRRGAPVPEGVRGSGNERFQQRWLRDEMFDALDRLENFAKESGRSPLELAMAWLLAETAVCSVIAGATSPEQLEQNAAAAERPLSASEREELSRLLS